jgi:hypothetical protein
VRQQVLGVFNQTEDDFGNVSDYYDYLERIEDIIYDLSNGIQVERRQQELEMEKNVRMAAIQRNNELKKKEHESVNEAIREQEKMFVEEDPDGPAAHSSTQQQRVMKEKRERRMRSEADARHASMSINSATLQPLATSMTTSTAMSTSQSTGITNFGQSAVRGPGVGSSKEQREVGGWTGRFYEELCSQSIQDSILYGLG